MSTQKIGASVVGLATVAAMLVGALPASAQTITATAAVSVPSVSASAQLSANATAKLSTVIDRGNADVAARIDALNALNTRVQDMKNASASEKSTIASEVQTNIGNLTTLKAKIDADADVTTARSDDQSIFTAYRIYALIVPQGWLLASTDRVTTITGLMASLGTQLQARITADQSAGKNVTAFTAALADMQAKIADANSQSATASASVSALTPDNGNQTIAAANKAALVSARANIKVATKDIQAARADITTILKGLKSLGVSASVSASTTPE